MMSECESHGFYENGRKKSVEKSAKVSSGS